MNPTLTPNSDSNNSLFRNSFENKLERESTEPTVTIEPLGEEDLVTHTEEHKADIKNSWAEFYSLKTETVQTIESPVNKVEITETKVEYQFTEKAQSKELQEDKQVDKPVFLIEEQKGSGLWAEDAGLKLDFKGLFKGLFGGFFKNLFGSLNVFKEIALDTTTMIVGKKEKAAKPAPKTEEEAKKKAENQRKQGNIKAFYEGLKAQSGSVASAEAIQAEAQEKENINKTIKLTNVSYKGIKNSFGRLTVYAASMFERESLDQEKKMKKIEKEQKMASAGGPDLSLDKAAEGGFLSSTGGQGAG